MVFGERSAFTKYNIIINMNNFYKKRTVSKTWLIKQVVSPEGALIFGVPLYCSECDIKVLHTRQVVEKASYLSNCINNSISSGLCSLKLRKGSSVDSKKSNLTKQRKKQSRLYIIYIWIHVHISLLQSRFSL